MFSMKFRHHSLDSSKHELNSKDAKKAETSEGNLNATQNPLKRVLPSNGCSNPESRKLIYELIRLANPESRKLIYEPIRLDTNTLKMVDPSASSVSFINNGSENAPFRTETEVEGINEIPHSKEISTCDWDTPSNKVPYTGPGQSTLHSTIFNNSFMSAQPQANGDNLSENDEVLQSAV